MFFFGCADLNHVVYVAFGESGVQSFDDIIEWGKTKLDPNQVPEIHVSVMCLNIK